MYQPQRHKDTESLNAISGLVVDSAIQVHKTLGPSLLESLYEDALCYELEKRNVQFERQRSLPVPYKNSAPPRLCG